MTKKDYIKFAAMIANEQGVFGKTSGCEMRVLESVAYAMSVIFAQDNPRFDRERFLQACGVAK